MALDSFINVGLVKNPLNWLTVIFMLLIAGILGHLLATLVGLEPATAATQN